MVKNNAFETQNVSLTGDCYLEDVTFVGLPQEFDDELHFADGPKRLAAPTREFGFRDSLLSSPPATNTTTTNYSTPRYIGEHGARGGLHAEEPHAQALPLLVAEGVAAPHLRAPPRPPPRQLHQGHPGPVRVQGGGQIRPPSGHGAGARAHQGTHKGGPEGVQRGSKGGRKGVNIARVDSFRSVCPSFFGPVHYTNSRTY
eukprot:185815-Pyramimonas_sp.AAC.1